MNETSKRPAPDKEAVAAEILAVQSSGGLGRSDLISRLFAYLVQCTLEARTPKESEVGSEVFGRDPSFDPTKDAVVRVYVHKLRRKLDAIYTGARKDAAARLNIPRGEYRLALVSMTSGAEPARAQPATGKGLRSVWGLAVLAIALMMATSAATWLASRGNLPPMVRHGLELRASQVWGPLLSSRLPTLVVLGDYYIFGESDDGVSVDRLVREYTVNSPSDLNAFLVQQPGRSGRYVDLDLRYLPVGSASALRALAPVLTSGTTSRLPRVILASELTPEMIRGNNIVYIGYLSGLGPLRDAVFINSRFSVGVTYDQLFDAVAKRRYTSEGGGPDATGTLYRDYGYFSSFQGPSGARIVIIAGTRDIGLMQTAEAATNISALRDLLRRAGGAGAFEALYDVEGMNRQNLGGQLIVASPIDSSAKWREGQEARKSFPAG